jgi:hypothetical protein
LLKRAAVRLVAAVLGAAAAWILPAMPLAAVFSPTPVTWNATMCPAGVYLVRSTAWGFGTGETFTTLTGPLRLPQDIVTQEFSNLPPGYYSVKAEAIRSDGLIFESSTVSLVGAGSALMGFGHQSASPPLSTTASNRGHRSAPPVVPTPPTDGPDGRDGSAARVRAGAGTLSPVSNAGAHAGPVLLHPSEDPPVKSLFQMLDLEDLVGTDTGWSELVVIDVDEDGIADFVAVELPTGGLMVWSIRPS